MTTPPEVPTVATEIYKLLQPLDSDSRKLAINGALAMLGDKGLALGKSADAEGDDDTNSDYPAKARRWMKQNAVTEAQLSQVFHDGEIIASMPSAHKTENAVSIYVLSGIAKLLATGEPKFDDSTARAACKSHNCLDQGNHSKTVKGSKNLLTGSTKAGYTLTAPGLKHGADLIKQIAQA
jgi:hypothetical protein